MKEVKKEFKFDLAKDPLESVVFDDNYEYRWVIYTYTTGPIANRGTRRITNFESKGWEIVYGTESTKSLTSKTSDETESKLMPVTENKAPAHKAVLMRCLKTKRAENERAKKIANDKRYQAMQARVERNGNNVTYTDHHIDINKLDQSTDINDLGD